MTMTKKRLILIALLPLAAAVTLGVLAMLTPSPGVTKANFDRIEKGMTIPEVEQIFGKKGESLVPADKTWLVWEAADGSWAEIWHSENCVTDKHWQYSSNSILDRIRRWLRLQ